MLPVQGARPKRPRRVPLQHEDLQPGSRFYEEVSQYKNHFVPLLEAEQKEDEAILRERLGSWSVEKLEHQGYCLTDMRAYWQEEMQFGKPVATFLLGPGIALPSQHRFEKGTQILVTKFDPLKEAATHGSVISSLEDRLSICFDSKFPITEHAWRLDIWQSSIAYERMLQAITRLNSDPADAEVRPGFPHDSNFDHELMQQGTFLRDILLRKYTAEQRGMEDGEEDFVEASVDPEHEEERAEQPHASRPLPLDGLFKHDALIQSWAKRYSLPDPIVIEGDPKLEGLNSTQIRAIAMMLSSRFALVQGPPGTGKTKTIIEAVKLLKLHFRVSYPILLCTYTNVAVDNILEGLVGPGTDISALRIGSSSKVKPSLLPYTLEANFERHPLAPAFEKKRKDAEILEKRISKLELEIKATEKKGSSRYEHRLANMEADKTQMERRMKAARAAAYTIRLEIITDIVTAADVVCTTCISSGMRNLDVSDFPLVFIDEASMSTEPASLIPLMRGSQHVALIGDHKQLPPVIISPEAQAQGLGTSLFERLSEENFLPSIMLDVQYRMHPTISRFPSGEFYNNLLRDGTIDAEGNVPTRLLPPESTVFPVLLESPMRPSVVFLDHVGAESMKDRSRVNWNEAHIVCSLVEDLLLNNETMRGKDIGVIAPYVAQISLLTRMFNVDHKYKERFEAVLGLRRACELSNVEIKTVDGFEGREKDVIIFSTVRNNAQGRIGFLADRRRLNVGLTRAKRGLFVIGGIGTLKQGRVSGGPDSAQRVGKGAEAWRRYAKYLADQNLVVKLDGEELRRMLYGNLPDGHGFSVNEKKAYRL